MNLLQVSPYVVHSPNDGGSNRAHGLVKEFPAAGGRVDRYCQGISSMHYREQDLRKEVTISGGYVEHRHVHPIHDIAKLPMLAGFPNVFSNNALRMASGPLSRLAEDADIALVREPWQVDAVDRLIDIPVVYSSHNVEAERFENLKEEGILENWAYRRVVELERKALERSEFVVCTSERDVAKYRDRFGYTGPSHVAPNATYQDKIRDHRPSSPRAMRCREEYGLSDDAVVATLVGSDHPPNVRAVQAMLDKMDDINDQIHFLVVGSISESVSSDRDDVTLTGFVDDLESVFDATDVALNPMVSGGGTNIKVLDYFARSLPVLSTPFGMRGIEAEDGEDAVIVDIDEFADALAGLTSDVDRRRAIGQNAKELVSRTYTWDGVSENLHRVLSEQVGELP